MYTHTLEMNIAGAEMGITEPIDRYGVRVFINSDPDYVSCAFKIDEEDKDGIAIFREFAARIAAHYKTLKAKSDLLAALKELLECDYTSGTHLYTAQLRAKEAILKATQ